MKKYLFLLFIPLFIACSSNDAKKGNDNIFAKDTRGLDILAGQFSKNIDKIWGVNELLVASRKDYVKYTDNFNTRSHISFEEGMITVESLGSLQNLYSAIVHTLLMGSDAKGIDLFASGDVPISNKPFLADLVMDKNGDKIMNVKQAGEFATYLIRHQLQKRTLANGRVVQLVTIPMVSNHIALRAKRYLPIVRKSSQRYGIDESLILGIMETESSFNPYAISYANAVGLMQIVPNTAGRDIFKLKGRSGKPSKNYLFNPFNNIDGGTSYLALLRDKYLDGITNPTSKRYAMISAYNSGAGAVLRVFDNDRDRALAKINKISPEQVYRILTKKHPSEQARRYLVKVSTAQKNYRVVR